MADDPITWLALDVVGRRIAQISILNGYFTDMGSVPLLRERKQVRESAAPFVLLLMADVGPKSGHENRSRSTVSELSWSLEFVQPLDDPASTEPDRMAHRARADIVRALHTDLRGETPGVSDPQVDGCDVGSDEDSRGAAVVITRIDGRITVTESIHPVTP